MARRSKAEDVADEPEVAEEAEPEVAPDPDVHVHIEGGGYVEHESAGKRERKIVHGGVHHEHVADTPEGIWSYRPM